MVQKLYSALHARVVSTGRLHLFPNKLTLMKKTAEKTKRKVAGNVIVDSGCLLIMDPLYASHWINSAKMPEEHYTDKKTDKVYIREKDFIRFDTVIDGATINEHINSGRFIRTDKPTEEFSMTSLVQQINSPDRTANFNFPTGEADMATAVYTGDGVYSIEVERGADGKTKKIVITVGD